MSFYTDAKIKYLKAKAFLEKTHPEVLERIRLFPNNVKTAWEGLPHATFMFRRQGPGFFALVNWSNGADIEEIALEDAVRQIACEWGTPRAEFSEKFWRYAKSDGIYLALKNYKPKGLQLGRSTIGDTVQAIHVLNKYRQDLPSQLRKFALDVAEDIQNYGTIPVYTVRRIAQVGNIEAENDAVEELEVVLQDVRSVRGGSYLQRVRERLDAEAVIVTVEKR